MTRVKNSRKQSIISQQLRKEVLSGEINDKLPTEKELSERFQCSTGTISKAVALLVHEGLVERKPRDGTRILRNQKSLKAEELDLNAFAFISPSDQHEGLWRMLRGFQQRAQEKNRRIVMLTADIDSRREMELISRLAEFEVQGAIIHPMVPSFQHLVQFSQVLESSHLPIVLAGSTLNGLEAPSVIVDGFHAGYTVTQHLIEQGCKRIGFLSDRAWSVSVRDRSLGYRWALRNAGLKIPPKSFMLNKAIDTNFADRLKFPTTLARKYLDSGALDEVDGVVCAYDIISYGLLEVLTERGIKVPEQFKVAGIDDYDSRNEELGLTSYRVSFEKLGAQAYELLEDLVTGKPNVDSQDILVSGDLVVRQST